MTMWAGNHDEAREVASPFTDHALREEQFILRRADGTAKYAKEQDPGNKWRPTRTVNWPAFPSSSPFAYFAYFAV